MTASLRWARPGLSPGSPAAFHAPLFHELVAELDQDARHVVLDLGEASTEMLALIGRSRSCVEVSDLAHFGGIEQLNGAESNEARIGIANSLLPNRVTDDPIDRIFLWDLPNYLSLESLSCLMHAIRLRAGPRALAHALIFYADREMHEHPGRFIPTADFELLNTAPETSNVAAPRYSPEDLGRAMGEFSIDRARLLGNGMQEFLFELLK